MRELAYDDIDLNIPSLIYPETRSPELSPLKISSRPCLHEE